MNLEHYLERNAVIFFFVSRSGELFFFVVFYLLLHKNNWLTFKEMFCCGCCWYSGLILYPLYADVFFIIYKPPDFMSIEPCQVVEWWRWWWWWWNWREPKLFYFCFGWRRIIGVLHSKNLFPFFYLSTKSHSFNHYFKNINSLRCGRTHVAIL